MRRDSGGNFSKLVCCGCSPACMTFFSRVLRCFRSSPDDVAARNARTNGRCGHRARGDRECAPPGMGACMSRGHGLPASGVRAMGTEPRPAPPSCRSPARVAGYPYQAPAAHLAAGRSNSSPDQSFDEANEPERSSLLPKASFIRCSVCVCCCCRTRGAGGRARIATPAGAPCHSNRCTPFCAGAQLCHAPGSGPGCSAHKPAG